MVGKVIKLIMPIMVNNKSVAQDLDSLKTAFLELAASHFTGTSLNLVMRALKLAEDAHAGQTRDDGTEYLFHPLRVAMTCMTDFYLDDAETICLALLHDTAEDQAWITEEYLSSKVGGQIAMDVMTLTKPDSSGFSRDEVNLIYFERLRHANERCKLVKLIDKLDNLRDVSNTADLTKRQRTANEAKGFYVKELIPNLQNNQHHEKISQLFDLAFNNFKE